MIKKFLEVETKAGAQKQIFLDENIIKYKEICLCESCWAGLKEKDESCLRY